MTTQQHRSPLAWAVFLLSSALIVATLVPIVYYGPFLLVYFPVFLMFGCDGARTAAGCLGILVSPFVAPALTIISLMWCRVSVENGWYLSSLVVATAACAISWLTILNGFG